VVLRTRSLPVQRYRQFQNDWAGRALLRIRPKCFSNNSRMSSKTPMRAIRITTVGCFAGSLSSRPSKARSSALSQLAH